MSTKDKVISAAIAAIRKAIKEDRSRRIRLNTPWTLRRLSEPVPDYSGRLLRIEDSTITILPNEECDGATLAPDTIGDWSLTEAAIVHDAIYGELEDIAAAWGWAAGKVRRWADDIFYGVAIEHAPNLIARIYWRGIRAFGGIAHKAGKILSLLALCLAISGCATPGDPFQPGDPHPAPDYTVLAP